MIYNIWHHATNTIFIVAHNNHLSTTRPGREHRIPRLDLFIHSNQLRIHFSFIILPALVERGGAHGDRTEDDTVLGLVMVNKLLEGQRAIEVLFVPAGEFSWYGLDWAI